MAGATEGDPTSPIERDRVRDPDSTGRTREGPETLNKHFICLEQLSADPLNNPHLKFGRIKKHTSADPLY